MAALTLSSQHEVALRATREVCHTAADRCRRVKEITIAERKGYGDVATDMDIRIQEYIIQELQKVLPEAAIYGEESNRQESRDGLYWSIDPIDGTNNFIYDLWPYAISVGLWNAGDPLFGVVHDISRNVAYFGHAGGAWAQIADGEVIQLQVSQREKAEDALVCFGLARVSESPETLAKIILDLQRHYRSTRKLGCTSMEIVMIAAGRTDGYVGLNVKHWDVGGAVPILQGAGGDVCDLDGKPYSGGSDIVCGHGPLIQDMLTLMKPFA